MGEFSYTERLGEAAVIEALVGNTVIAVTDTTLELSNGVVLEVEKETSECCSWLDLVGITRVPGLITKAEFRDDEDETDATGSYKAWIHVITEAGEFNLVDADGDASNGYYLHGFALGVRVLESVQVTWHVREDYSVSETRAMMHPEDPDDLETWVESYLWPIVRKGPASDDGRLRCTIALHSAQHYGETAVTFPFERRA